MKKIIAVFILFTGFGLTSCNLFTSLKPKEPFYCKINGEKFRPEQDDSPVGGIGTSPLDVRWNSNNRILSIYVRGNGKLVGLKLVMPTSSIDLGTYKLSNIKSGNVGVFSPNNDSTNPIDIISSEGNFSITKIDGYNITGNFNFSCQDSVSKIEYKITEGQFNDISYY